MRAAIYARYSSEVQRDTLLEDQIAVARRHATERSWTVPKDHIYTDAGISSRQYPEPPERPASARRGRAKAEGIRCGARRRQLAHSPATFR